MALLQTDLFVYPLLRLDASLNDPLSALLIPSLQVSLVESDALEGNYFTQLLVLQPRFRILDLLAELEVVVTNDRLTVLRRLIHKR